MKIANVRIYGLEESAVASGYPMLAKSMFEDEFIEQCENNSDHHVNRLIRLGGTNSGEGHDCALKGVVVQYDLTCNHVMLPQFMRYHFHDIISSQSKMHKLLNMDLDKAFDKGVDPEIVRIVKCKITEYKNCLEWNRVKPERERLSKEYLQQLYENIMSSLPMGLELTMRVDSNYLQLKSIFKQRRGHKMSFWQDYCNWIEGLPHMKEVLKNEIKITES